MNKRVVQGCLAVIGMMAFVFFLARRCATGPGGALSSDDAGVGAASQPSSVPIVDAGVGAVDQPPVAPVPACSGAHRVDVSDGRSLAAAIAAAKPGDWIQLAPGTYGGRFVLTASGTAASPIALCGTRAAILDGGDVTTGYGIDLKGSYWILGGFTVQHAKKGIVVEGSSHDLIASVEVRHIGNEGIRFRAFSSDDTVRDSWVHDTGETGDPRIGEGIYIGTFVDQWCQNSGCAPDACDRNQILDNTVGPNDTAENIDVKEGTTGGIVRGNKLDGTGIQLPGADSWMDVKGNGWLIEGNHGTRSPNDGFQVHVRAPGWGNQNVFRGNVAEVQGPGYGFMVAGGEGNIIACDNETQSAGKGPSNVPCTQTK